jgi:6-phosphogluconolactonase
MKPRKTSPEIQIVPSVADLALAAALHFVYRGKSAIAEKNLFTVALSGDSMPNAAYLRLVDDTALNKQLPWGSVHFFCTDARYATRDKARRERRLASESVLEKLPLPPDNVHRIKGNLRSAGRAAYDYERHLRKFFALKPRQLPRFDLVLLGIGADGQIASLFPHSGALRKRKRLVIAERVDAMKGYRITMTVPVLNNAAHAIFLVSGEDKADALRAAINGDYQPLRYLAQLIRPRNGKTLWLIDRAAAVLLRNGPGKR